MVRPDFKIFLGTILHYLPTKPVFKIHAFLISHVSFPYPKVERMSPLYHPDMEFPMDQSKPDCWTKTWKEALTPVGTEILEAQG